MKTKISEWSTTPASNTDIDGINIAEGCAPSGINDAIRDLMAQVRSWQSGASGDPFNGPMNGTIGATTAYSGAFTTVSATGVITSTLATGTAPLTIASTTKVTNLNADLLDGADWASPAALGSTTPAAVSATTLSASGAVTLSGGTANGVTYLNGSKVLTSGSALTFDGQTLTNTRDTPILVLNDTAASNSALRLLSTGGISYIQSGISGGSFASLAFTANGGGSEQMRLTSTGLGIGISSVTAPLTFKANTGRKIDLLYNSASDQFAIGVQDYELRLASGSGAFMSFYTGGYTGGSEKMRLDSSGNLGLGVTPSATSGGKSLEIGYVGSSVMSTATGQMNMTANVYYNSGWKYAGTGTALLYQQSALTGVNAWYTAASGTAGNAISWTQAMTLDASGNLGVGTTSPSARVEIAQSIGGGNGVGLILNDFGSSGANEGMHIQWRSGTDKQSDQCRIGQISNATGSGSNLAFYTNGADTGTATERARIDSSGNLLVGTTSNPLGARLFGDGGTSTNAVGAYSQGSGGYVAFYGRVDSTSNYLALWSYSGSAVGSITTNGSVTLYNTTSDQRLKENIQESDSASSLIDSLQVRKFDWKANGSHQRYGFVAQELLTVAPEAVYQPEDAEAMMAVDYSKLVPMLVKEIQSLRQRVAQLETN